MEKKQQVLIYSGLAIVVVAAAYIYSKRKSISIPSSNTVTGYANAIGSNICWACCATGDYSPTGKYSQTNVNNAINNLEANGYTQLEASEAVQNAMTNGQSITSGKFSSATQCTQNNCQQSCFCNPSKCIHWYNPLSWKL